jgi:hypothetical protein
MIYWGFTGFLITLLAIAGLWKLFQKADEPGWAAIIPIYNTWVMAKIAGMNPVMIILLIIPLVNVIFAFVLAYKFVESFGFGVGGFLLYLLFNPLMAIYMGFSSEVTYVGKKY